jgi:N-acetylglucosamine repressor
MRGDNVGRPQRDRNTSLAAANRPVNRRCHAVRKIDTRNFKRATRSTSREINRQIALNLVREHQPISRADLARRMQIGRGVVTSLVGQLIIDDMIYEGASGPAGRGRPARMLYVRTRDRLGIGIDIRFSRTYMALGDFSGTQLALETFETMQEPEALVAELVRRGRRLLEAYGATGRCEGVGVVVPGIVELRTGRVLNAPQLGWRNVDIRNALSAGFGLPVHIENAPMACALAKMWLGQHGDGTGADFVYITVSDGVGTGVVMNGRLVRGKSNSAGEFGHFPVEAGGTLCLCGARGCLEAYTSNLATIARYLGRELSTASTRELLHAGPLSIQDLIARAQSGDQRAVQAIEETGHYLGVGIAGIVNAVNPAQVFVAGEITAAWERIQGTIQRAIEERALTLAAATTPVIPEQMGGYPRLRGAMALVTAPMFAAPEVA